MFYNLDLYRYLGFYVIVLLEVSKVVLVLLVVIGLEIFGLQLFCDVVNVLIWCFSLDLDYGILFLLFNMISFDVVYFVVVVMVVYGVLYFFEVWGFWCVKVWVFWLGCVIVGIYLLFDVYVIICYFGWVLWLVLVINLIVVGVFVCDICKWYGGFLVQV